MFQCFYPSKMEESSYVIPYENWKKMGMNRLQKTVKIVDMQQLLKIM